MNSDRNHVQAITNSTLWVKLQPRSSILRHHSPEKKVCRFLYMFIHIVRESYFIYSTTRKECSVH